MVSPASSSQRETINQLQVDVGVIKAGQKETNRRLGNIESAIGQFAFVKQSEFDEFRKEVRDTFATKEEVKPMKTLFWAIITASAVAIIGVIVGRFAK